MVSYTTLHSAVPHLRLANRRASEYCGPCPFCGGTQRSDRFRVWLTPERERYWCRRCDAKGSLRSLIEGDRPRITLPPPSARRTQRGIDANPAHIPFYREIYSAIALWAHANLWDDCNPDPLAYLRGRGLGDPMIGAALLGYTLSDPASLPTYLRQTCPELLPYAEAAGVLVRWDGVLRAHPNLCGRILLPYIADGLVTDLRSRAFPGKGYTSLAGGYSDRGATALFGWDTITEASAVLLTEGEFKALAVSQAYRAGQLSLPALAHPGLSYWRDEWAELLISQGVRSVTLAYDSQPRPSRDGQRQLAPEEIWTIRHGQRLRAAGLDVRVLRLPLAPGATKADLDEYLAQHGPAALERLISAAPSLADYHASLPRTLLREAKLAPANAYPRHRARPLPKASCAAPLSPATISLDAVRGQIPALVQDHTTGGEGFLVLAHPPGAGKGYGTTAGLRAYLHDQPAPGQIVWSALRKNQIADQHGLELTPLHGRNLGNCRKHAEAQVLADKGYNVRASLCERRCPFSASCIYLRQFGQDADLFAPQPLLLATGWWQEAQVLVLDEFDPARLAQVVPLSAHDLVVLHRTAPCPHAQTLLRWLLQLVGESIDCALRGGLILSALAQLAAAEGLRLSDTLRAAAAALPSDEDQARLPGLPTGASLAEYAALPSGQLARLIRQLDAEARLQLGGQPFTSRLEISEGRLLLLLRHEHLLAQLARPEQPKILLDATINETLLRALFPTTPIQIERPALLSRVAVRQVLRADWAKSTLHGARREEWYDTVASQVNPTRPTLVVCTQACEADLQQALAKRGLTRAEVAHYGALRGSNRYKGYDVVLAQIYHPNLDAVLREGRALFAGSGAPLDEQIVISERTLTDAGGRQWAIQVPSFADPRLAAVLELRRESEMEQAALRGRPLDHPAVQITLLFSLPLPGLTPTEVIDEATTSQSNSGRQATTILRLIGGARQILDRGQRQISVADLVTVTGASAVTVRKHWQEIAQALALEAAYAWVSGPGRRAYQRAVLVMSPQSMDQAHDHDMITSLIHAPAAPDESPDPAPACADHANSPPAQASHLLADRPRSQAAPPPSRSAHAARLLPDPYRRVTEGSGAALRNAHAPPAIGADAAAPDG